LGREEFFIVGKGIIKKIHFPGMKGIIALGVIIAALVGVLFAGNLFNDDIKVDYFILTEGEIPQEITTQVIPEYRGLERALACKVDDKIYVVVSRGEKPTSGFEVFIDRMWLEDKDNGKNLVVLAIFRDPEPGASLAQVLTYPLKVAETNLSRLPDQIELRVQY
jgi:hypothetical protein